MTELSSPKRTLHILCAVCSLGLAALFWTPTASVAQGYEPLPETPFDGGGIASEGDPLVGIDEPHRGGATDNPFTDSIGEVLDRRSENARSQGLYEGGRRADDPFTGALNEGAVANHRDDPRTSAVDEAAVAVQRDNPLTRAIDEGAISLGNDDTFFGGSIENGR